jgi:hypothetical protein
MTDEPHPGALAAALAAAWGELRNPTKGRTAEVKSAKGNYSYAYASIDDVLDTVRPVLSRHGLAVSQVIEPLDGVVFLVSRLMHSSGEEVVSRYPLDWSGGSQQYGAELTYARRYSLEALVGVAASADDDDQESRDRAPAPKPKAKPKPPPKGPPADEPARDGDEPDRSKHDPSWDEDRSGFFGTLADLGYGHVPYEHIAAFCESLKISRPSAMNRSTRKKLLDRLGTEEGSATFWDWKNAYDNDIPF